MLLRKTSRSPEPSSVSQLSWFLSQRHDVPIAEICTNANLFLNKSSEQIKHLSWWYHQSYNNSSWGRYERLYQISWQATLQLLRYFSGGPTYIAAPQTTLLAWLKTAFGFAPTDIQAVNVTAFCEFQRWVKKISIYVTNKTSYVEMWRN